MNINPDYDGIDHINIYSKGKTEIGRLLSNFANTPVELEEDGKFESLEGYYFWLRLDSCKDKESLRKLSGWKAKNTGQELLKNYSCIPEGTIESIMFETIFKEKFIDAIFIKAEQNDNIWDLIIQDYLPFKHYYVYGGKVVNAGFGWMVEAWEDVRRHLQELEIKYPKIPCKYSIAWQGQCGRRAIKDEFCKIHYGVKCRNHFLRYGDDAICNKQAVADCSNVFAFVCGSPYCEKCGSHKGCR